MRPYYVLMRLPGETDESFVLILLYPYESFSESSQRIQRIRALYKERFGQESVLRSDDPYVVWVSF